jgi:hypothetical protein
MKEYSLKKENKSTDFDYIDQDGTSYNSPQEWVWSFLGGCGCGSSDDFAEKCVKLLYYFSLPHDERDLKGEVNPYEHEVYELLAHWFDSIGFIEHGTSVSSSWLSEKGRKINEIVEKLKV